MHALALVPIPSPAGSTAGAATTMTPAGSAASEFRALHEACPTADLLTRPIVVDGALWRLAVDVTAAQRASGMRAEVRARTLAYSVYGRLLHARLTREPIRCTVPVRDARGRTLDLPFWVRVEATAVVLTVGLPEGGGSGAVSRRRRQP